MVEDFRFALLRHWSLYEAMLHSSYVAVRLQTWTDHGRRRLQELLARMGFLLTECCHDYGASRVGSRKDLLCFKAVLGFK